MAGRCVPFSTVFLRVELSEMAKKKAGDGDNTGGRGRPPKTRDVSRERLAKRFEKLDFKRRHRNALLSAVSELFCRGYTVGDIREQCARTRTCAIRSPTPMR